MQGKVVLVGAGELMASMARVHRDALAALGQPPRPVFLDATAGFETNVDAIIEKAVEYYRHYLQTDLSVARYRHREQATPNDVATALAAIKAANLIFAGPGSPTYAIRHWRGSPVWDAVVRRHEAGAHLVLASAAAITAGRYSLPVYEIYKAGEDPFWVEGLDLLGRLGLSLAIIPHFNDASGGENYDTRFCYMGARRFDRLQELLPAEVTILGIDAYTAVSLDPETRTARVTGQDGVTVIGDGARSYYRSGSEIPFEALASRSRQMVATLPGTKALAGYEFADHAAGASGDALAPITAYIERLGSLSDAEKIETLSRLHDIRRGLASSTRDDGPLVELILDLRQTLRQLKRFDLADRARDVLAGLGYEIQDSPSGSSWTRL
jgi:cyanophycinase-like exopeptidase